MRVPGLLLFREYTYYSCYFNNSDNNMHLFQISFLWLLKSSKNSHSSIWLSCLQPSLKNQLYIEALDNILSISSFFFFFFLSRAAPGFLYYSIMCAFNGCPHIAVAHMSKDWIASVNFLGSQSTQGIVKEPRLSSIWLYQCWYMTIILTLQLWKSWKVLWKST